MSVEISSMVKENPVRIVEWANSVQYNRPLSAEDKEISAEMNEWAKNLGRNGFDRDHELSQLIQDTFTPDAVETPSFLLDNLFDEGAIGEFDDLTIEVEPKNTLVAYDGAFGGNVDRSYIDSRHIKPVWKHLQVETDLSLREVRRGGFKTVANLLTYINEAMELKRLAAVIDIVDNAITAGHGGYIEETGARPTETSASALALYLADMRTNGNMMMFGLNKYIHDINMLEGSKDFMTDAIKDMYRNTGFINMYQGCELIGVTSRAQADGTILIPDKRIFGAAGKIGKITTRGEANVYQETDINAEKIHIKVNGYQFGVSVTDIDKVGKIVLE